MRCINPITGYTCLWSLDRVCTVCEITSRPPNSKCSVINPQRQVTSYILHIPCCQKCPSYQIHINPAASPINQHTKPHTSRHGQRTPGTQETSLPRLLHHHPREASRPIQRRGASNTAHLSIIHILTFQHQPARKTKPTKTPKSESTSLIDDFTRLLDQASYSRCTTPPLTHTAEIRPLGARRRSIRESAPAVFPSATLTHSTAAERSPRSKTTRRFIEICTDHTLERASDSDDSDRYEDDEEEGLPARRGHSKALGVQPKSAGKAGHERLFKQPDYETLGGVCWQLLTKLRSRT